MCWATALKSNAVAARVTQAPPFLPSKSEPVHLIVPLVVAVVFPINTPPLTCNFSVGSVVPIPTLATV